MNCHIILRVSALVYVNDICAHDTKSIEGSNGKLSCREKDDNKPRLAPGDKPELKFCLGQHQILVHYMSERTWRSKFTLAGYPAVRWLMSDLPN